MGIHDNLPTQTREDPLFLLPACAVAQQNSSDWETIGDAWEDMGVDRTFLKKPLPFSGKRSPHDVLDLCDFNDAVTGGLDGGNIDSSRANLGINCNDNSGVTSNRFGVVRNDGELDFYNEHTEAIKASRKPLTLSNFIPLGYYGTFADFTNYIIPKGKRNELVIIDGSLNFSEGYTFGLAANLTPATLGNVSFTLADVSSFNFPIDVQPGEVIPFKLAGESRDSSNITISYDRKGDVTKSAGRAIAIDGMPGFWKDPNTPPPIPYSKVQQGYTEYFETTWDVDSDTIARLVRSSKENSHTIDDVVFVVAQWDEENKLTDVDIPESDDSLAYIHLRHSHFSIWAGGTLTKARGVNK